MKTFRPLHILVLAIVAFAAPAFAWNCSDPLASRVDVGPTNPGGTAGDGDGQWYKGTDAANPNDYYVCEVPKKPTPPTPTPTSTTQSQTQTQGQSQTQGQTANGGSSSSTATGGNSTATGGAVSGSGNSSSKSGVSNSGNSTATGGQGGSATANGGAGGQGGQGGTGGSVAGSGNSTNKVNTTTTVAPVITSTNKLSNSGNSSNTNTNTAKGGSANGNGSNNTTAASASGNGSGNQTSASSNQSSSNSNQSSAAGAGANSNDTTNNIAASKIPVNTAYAPTTIPTSPCLKGYSAGGQGAAFGFAVGGSKEDKNCELIEMARSYDSMNERLAGCKIKISSELSKKAGITLADCMAVEMVDRPIAVAPAPPAAPQQPIVVVVPSTPAPAVTPVVAPAPAVSPAIVWTSVCTFGSKTACSTPGSDAVIIDPSHPTSVCGIMINSAARAFRRSPGARFILVGNRNRDESDLLPTARANNVRRQLEEAGVPSSAITVQVGSGTTRTVEIVLIQQDGVLASR